MPGTAAKESDATGRPLATSALICACRAGKPSAAEASAFLWLSSNSSPCFSASCKACLCHSMWRSTSSLSALAFFSSSSASLHAFSRSAMDDFAAAMRARSSLKRWLCLASCWRASGAVTLLSGTCTDRSFTFSQSCRRTFEPTSSMAAWRAPLSRDCSSTRRSSHLSPNAFAAAACPAANDALVMAAASSCAPCSALTLSMALCKAPESREARSTW
mmetsp:Transcript_27778/g.87757  ORF Transcript_27778/g.87757 Transcript_27778/m.87757 type:complete len:217 (-) Transcript_27778:862-1512(-)